MNKYLIEYYNIPPNERLEVVQLPNEVPDTMHLEWTAINWKNNSNAYKLAELDGYFVTRNVNLAEIEDKVVGYNNAWWLYTKADSVKEAIDKFYDIFNRPIDAKPKKGVKDARHLGCFNSFF